MNTSVIAIIKHEIFDKTVKRVDFADKNGILLENKKFCYAGIKFPLFLLRLPFALIIGICKAIIVLIHRMFNKGYVHTFFFTAYFNKEYEGHLVTNYDIFYKERNKIQREIKALREKHFNSDLEEGNSGFLYEEVEIL